MLEEAQNWERQQTNHFVGKLVWETNQIRAYYGPMVYTIAYMQMV